MHRRHQWAVKKKLIFHVSRCELLHLWPVLGRTPNPIEPAPAGRRNLQNLHALSQIYRKFRAPPTLHYFTRKNQYFTHFTALYTRFRPLSGLHTHVAYRLLMYLGAHNFFGTSRARCPLPVHSPPPSSCSGGVTAFGPAKRAQPPVNFSG